MPLPANPIVLVTGATDGIGRETALELARRGARVLPHGRSQDRLDALVKNLRTISVDAALEPVRADLASLAEVRAMAAEVARRGVPVSVLLNNAGVYQRKREESADGFELTFAVNHLSHFLLTLLLLESTPSLERIVNVSSGVHASGTIDPERAGRDRGRYDAYAAYADSKLANVLFTVELARRLSGRGVTVNALHPGVVSTKLLTQGFGMGGRDTLEASAATSVLLALDPGVAGLTGRYFAYEREAPMSAAAADRALTKRFFDESARLASVTPVAG
jgi:NAD(P)-dependent dehydrogenase (short-subunit alcohol dehydrogenase family)